MEDRVLAHLPKALSTMSRDEVPLRSFDMIGLPALRALLSGEERRFDAHGVPSLAPRRLPGLAELAGDLATADRGLIMVMGKGGVGKTTVASAIAVGLARRKRSVHLSTTDPAAHVATTVGTVVDGLTVDRIDPKAETLRYIAKVMDSRKNDLDPEGLALLREDLNSPCTEEVAVFHAFSRVVAEARSAFVVLDTAPTGHTLLLMDATGAYHRQMVRDLDPNAPGRIVTPLMRLQDPDYTKVILVTLPETTPVSEASALQDDLRRAKIEPYAWVINRTLAASGTTDPLLVARLPAERAQTERVRQGLAKRLFDLPWQAVPPVGIEQLSKLVVSVQN
jgi:arsenite-transporting ATPase